MFVLCYSYNTFQECICASYLLKYPSLPYLLISKIQYFSKLPYAHLQELDGNSLRLSTNPTCPTFLQIWPMKNNGKTYGRDTGNVFISIEVYRCVCVYACTRMRALSHSVMYDSLQPHQLQPTRLLCPWGSPGQYTGVGCHALLQGIFQGLNPGLPHCRWILYHLSHQGSPRILNWVAYPFSGGSSHARNQTRISCSAGGFFTS